MSTNWQDTLYMDENFKKEKISIGQDFVKTHRWVLWLECALFSIPIITVFYVGHGFQHGARGFQVDKYLYMYKKIKLSYTSK